MVLSRGSIVYKVHPDRSVGDGLEMTLQNERSGR